MAEDKTIQQEMEALGIKPENFDILYGYLQEHQKLPLGDMVPWDQYLAIVNYLRDKQILGKDNKVQPDGIKVFDYRRRLETILSDADNPTYPDEMRSSGGLLPCTSGWSESAGGVVPCRDWLK